MDVDSLKKIVGSLLVLGFEGTKVSESLKNFLQQWDLGGVILFKRNIESLEQVAALNDTVFQLAAQKPIVSVDHEGGKVFRLLPPFTSFSPMRRVGERCAREKNWDLARQVGSVFGKELRAVGFNVDYAPVLDVDSNPKNPIIGDRAFSSDPEAVAKAALAFSAGLEAEGVVACGKHFPGHGDTAQDSHLTLPSVEKSREELETCELIPFTQAAQNNIPMLMTAHVMYPSLDKEWPATLSEKILTGLLRGKMGYQGMIISDDFFMKGIAEKWNLEEATERFLLAGGDLVLLCHQEAVQRRVAANLVHRAEKDSDFRRLLEEKSQKMKRFREGLRLGLETANLALVGSKQHLEITKSFS
jgi:beta-N-acetylhexosaminidase